MDVKKKVFAAMSGGVDSAVAAYLLLQQGFAVTGIHMELSRASSGEATQHIELEEICRKLEIPLQVLHLEDEFRSRVIDYYCREYERGSTPNPCVRCNRTIKFGALLERVLEMGGDCLATGHYARVEATEKGFRLLKGCDAAKDQSYFLYVLGQSELARVIFPLGGMKKSEVKTLAEELGLEPHISGESQDACFIPSGDKRAFIEKNIATEPGEIVDTSGKLLGHHRGLAYYTVGQRQGMGVSSSERLYVVRLEPAANRLVIGTRDELFKSRLTATGLNWVSGKAPGGRVRVEARVRYRAAAAPAEVLVLNDVQGIGAEVIFDEPQRAITASRAEVKFDEPQRAIAAGRAEVIFDEPQRAIAAGQSVVFYQGDVVLGGGTVIEAY